MKKKPFCMLVLAIFASFGLATERCSAEPGMKVSVEMGVNGQLADEITISVQMAPEPLVRIRLCLIQDMSCAVATYVAQGGRVNSATSESLEGTYLGVDPAGLFWSMEVGALDDEVRASIERIAGQKRVSSDSLGYYLRVESGQEKNERIIAPSAVVTHFSTGSNEFPDSMDVYLPPQPGNYPIVVYFDGQPPSRSNRTLLWLTLKGYVVVYADYFKTSASRDPECLKEAKLDEFIVGLPAIRDQLSLATSGKYQIKGSRFRVLGVSRGVEAALWLAHLRPEFIDRLVLVSGAPYAAPACSRGESVWSLGGRALPSSPVSPQAYLAAERESREGGTSLLGGYFERLKAAGQPPFEIPLNCKAPTLLVFGNHDLIAQPERLAKRLIDTCGAQAIGINSGHEIFGTPWVPRACPLDRPSSACSADMQARLEGLAEIERFLGK